MEGDEDGDGDGPDTQRAITEGLVRPRQAGERSENHGSFELFHQELVQSPLLHKSLSAILSMQLKHPKFPELCSNTLNS